MSLVLINLNRSVDRLQDFNALNGHIRNVERFSAIDGSRLDRRRLEEGGFVQPDLCYSPGVLGSALSHMTLWHRAIAEDRPVTVIEDDAILCANFEVESARILAGLPQDWEFVLWGYNFDAPLTFNIPGMSPCNLYFDQDMLRSGSAAFPRQSVSASTFPLYRAFGIVCYTISPRGAERLGGYCLPLRSMDVYYPGLGRSLGNTSIDYMMAQAWPHMQAHVSFPPLAVTDNDWARSTNLNPAPAAVGS